LHGLRGYDMLKLYFKKPKMKQTMAKNTSRWRQLAGLPVLVIAVLLIIGGAVIPSVRADSFDAQIKELQDKNSQNRNALGSLMDQASSYQDAISKLQAQIDSLQGLINANVARQVDLQNQIVQAQAELDRQKAILGADIKKMYTAGDRTTIELLASSGSITKYFDEQAYRNAVQKKIQDTLKKITELQNQLKEKKAEVDKLLDDQRSQQAQLDKDRAQQASLLAYNQDQQNQYNQQIKSNQSKIADLRRQQAIENAKLFHGGLINVPDSSGYPWADKPFPGGGYDPWGMEYRQCVAYTAWRVYHETGYMYGWGNIGLGNANEWDEDARAAGLRVDSDPTGDVVVGIKNSEPYGHAVFIEHVYSGSEIYVSQYNALWDGRYSEARISTAGWVFIHFR
jgi:surface antigen